MDATCMWMVKNPEWFDVIVTSNMFGNIITGGIGIAAGGNINPQGVSMFEAIRGSAPKYTGRNIINPLAAISSVDLMLCQLGEEAAGKAIDAAIVKATSEKIKDLGAGGWGTRQAKSGI